MKESKARARSRVACVATGKMDRGPMCCTALVGLGASPRTYVAYQPRDIPFVGRLPGRTGIVPTKAEILAPLSTHRQ